MDQEVVFIVFLICHLVLTKRNITNGNIKKIIRKCRFLIPIHGNIGFRI